jgi:hypothetical protein
LFQDVVIVQPVLLKIYEGIRNLFDRCYLFQRYRFGSLENQFWINAAAWLK